MPRCGSGDGSYGGSDWVYWTNLVSQFFRHYAQHGNIGTHLAKIPK